MEKRWETYNKVHASRKPREQLVRAVSFCDTRDSALDLGAGTLVESKYLLSAGFKKVTAVDSSELSKDFAKDLPVESFELQISSFQEFVFQSNTYDLINAQFSLPFHGVENFDSFIANITSSLKQRGIFVGQFFGTEDGWNTPESNLAFHTKEQVLEYLKEYEVIELVEENKEGSTAAGNSKYWHIFHFIAKKI